jgi:unsaturated rhamnogalacturonyl hydrolase
MPAPAPALLRAALGSALLAGLLLPPAAGEDAARPDPFAAPAIASVMKRANRWQVDHAPRDGEPRDWIRGTWYTGVMAAYLATGDRTYLEQATRWAADQRWQPGTEKAGANILTCAQTYLELYFLHPDRAYIGPTIAWLDSGSPKTPSGARVWYLDGDRYADSLYVGAPALAMLAKATGNPRYLAWMDAFFWDVEGALFDREDGLFYRDPSFIASRTANGRKVFWSRGNGWVFASLPRILTYLPDGDPGRGRYEALFRTMAAAIVKRQQDDGLWRPNLDDPQDPPMRETSGTGFFCYGLGWGVRQGLLPRAPYGAAADRAWAGLLANLSPEGKVLWGQTVADRPEAVQPGDTREYVTGTFLLAGSEMYRLAR